MANQPAQQPGSPAVGSMTRPPNDGATNEQPPRTSTPHSALALIWVGTCVMMPSHASRHSR